MRPSPDGKGSVVRLGRTADATTYGRQIAAAAFAVVVMLLLLAPGAAAVGPLPAPAPAQPTFVPPALAAAASANPDQVFRVIVQGRQANSFAGVKAGVQETLVAAPSTGDGVNGTYSSIHAVAAELTGE